MPHSDKSYSTKADLKDRWGGLLEHPFISRIQRTCLDGLRVEKLSNILRPFDFENVLDVCCGVGEYSSLKKCPYVGIDNSLFHIAYAQKKYKVPTFIDGDAKQLPFQDNTFSAVMLACASHHFSDRDFREVLSEMKRVSRKYLIVDDAVRTVTQSPASKFFYKLDRGTNFRTMPEMEQILQGLGGWKIALKQTYTSFPGIYLHAVFVLTPDR